MEAVDAPDIDAFNVACAHWQLFIFFMPPLHRSQSMGKSSSSARKAGRDPLTFDGSGTATLDLRHHNAFHSDAGHNTPVPTLDEFGRNDF
jgi:hypothetical protein